ncbi:MAG: methyltransferase [Streptosporangiaceae bacterium]
MAHELPPPAQMILLLGGFRVSQALYAAAALGVADHLVAGPAPAEVLAGHTGAHAPSLRRLLRTLASVGVFTEPEPGVFALNPLGQLLASGQPGSMRDVVIMFMETHYAPFGDLLDTIRTGQPAAERFYGQPFFAWLAQHPEQASRYTAAMASLTGGFKGAAIAALPLDGTGTIIDVGGADGTMLAAILAAHPHMRGVLFDLPHVIAGAPGVLAGHGVGDRAECVAGDFLEAVPPGGDAYLASLVLHDWPERQARRILANIAAAGGSGARLLLIEFVVPPGDAPHLAKISDLNMLAMMGGQERTETEWREFLTDAGYAGITIRPTGTPFSVIEATVR